MTIKIIIADDHVMVRKGLAMFLREIPDFNLLAEAANGQEAIDVCQQFEPDIVLMDLKMPELDGIAATIQIRQRFPSIQVIALTSFNDKDLIESALQAGVRGFIYKDIGIEDLADAIRKVAQGKPSLAPQAVQVLLDMVINPPQEPTEHELSEREQAVLKLLTDGLTNQQIAYQLSISLATVKQYVSKILAKLRASSRTEAVSIALRDNLLK